ncbi:MAG: hypothetical protein ABIQ39_07595, partial [Ilumatobacteraceae bacterium]
GNSGDDLCGQLPQKQPVNRANTGFTRTNEAGVDQFMTNAIEVYDSPASADIEFEHEVSVVQNCTDGSQTINGIKVAEVMSALRAPADLMKSFPGCEKGVTVLIHSTAPEVQFDNNTSVWYMRCGNVLTSISVDQPSSADGADATSQMVIGAQAGFARVSRLPLSH